MAESRVKDTDLAYVAGLFDGDGCILFDKYSNALRIQIDNTNEFVSKWLSEKLEAHVIKYKSVNQKQMYQNRWYSRKAITLLKKILPFLKIKKEQAKIAIELQELMSDSRTGRKFETLEYKRKKKELIAKLRSFSKKGVRNG